jgi:hypothetical protein
MRRTFRYVALAGAIGLGACDLVVDNPNQPGTDKVLATPRDVETLLGSYYNRWHVALYRGVLGGTPSSLTNLWGMANVMSFEDYSSLANNCMNQRASIPRPANDNSIGNGCNNEQMQPYFTHAEVARVATNGIVAFRAPGFTLGSRAQDLRALAFGEFLRGLSLGYLALIYDSAAVTSPDMSLAPADCLPDASGTCIGELRPYREVMDSALAALQRALDSTAASAAATGSGFPLPPTWISSPTSFTAAEFTKLIRSYRARLRANVARTPAERADISQGGIVDWAAVIADVGAGITANHENITSTTTGPYNSWVNQWHSFSTWHQMSPFVIGMADNSGSYAAWIAQPVDQRGSTGPFFMTTPDLRFPQGGTRGTQQLDFAITQCSAASTACKRYFVNRPGGNDSNAGFGWGWSNYDFVRFYSWRTSGDGTGQNGRLVFMTKAEMDLLAAEGHIRLGNFAAALPLVNATRTAGMSSAGVATGGGLPAIAAADNTTPVPGGADCVPKVPQGPAFNTVACGNLMEAMKYEKRIETAYTHFAAWYLDMRGWGDLAEGTPVHWPVPYTDLQARGRPASGIYSTGGTGSSNPGGAAKGTYGW